MANIYDWPLPEGSPISQAFGENTEWTRQFNPPGGHNGNDYAVPHGTPVRAPGAGVIQHAGWVTGNYWENPWWLIPMAGIVVVLDCGEVAFTFSHLNDTDLNVGDRVERGQIIGHVGNTSGTDVNGNKVELATHLHFEALPDGWDFANGFYGRVSPARYCSTYWNGTVEPQGGAVTPIMPIEQGAQRENWVDLSSHNFKDGHTVDFAALKRGGATGVIFKASEGVGWQDIQSYYSWLVAVKQARDAGLKIGFYHWARPTAENAPSIEADWFVRCIQYIYRPGDKLVLDWEPDEKKGESKTNIAWAKVWLDAVRSRMQADPRNVWFYTYSATLRLKADWGLINATYPLWQADYWTNRSQGWGPNPAQKRDYVPDWPAGLAGWQYTSSGLVLGVTKSADLNVIYPFDQQEDTLSAAEVQEIKDYIDLKVNFIAADGKEGSNHRGPLYDLAQEVAAIAEGVKAIPTPTGAVQQIDVDALAAALATKLAGASVTIDGATIAAEILDQLGLKRKDA